MSQYYNTLAKFTPPRLVNVYKRMRLFELLDAESHKPVVWIAGPAGSGKTTLITSYLKENNINPLWYRVDEGDADPASFFYYLGQLGQQIAPDETEQFPLLTPEYLAGLPVFTRNFFRKIYNSIDSPGALVFDNFQDAGDDIPLHTLLPRALEEIPDGIRVIIISREDPPASVVRMRTTGQIALLNWEQLRLSDEESIGFGKLQSGQAQLDNAFYINLNQQVDGWVTGMVLYLEHAGHTIPFDKVLSKENRRYVFTYFAGEIFEHLDDWQKRILLCTAFLPRIKVSTAIDLSADDNAGYCLSELARRNFFTIRHVGPTESYEYHPLFREFLQTHATQTLTPDQLNELLRITASQLQAEGQTEDAVELLQRAEDWDSACQLILESAQTLIEQGRNQTVSHWLKSLPERVLNDQPWLRYWQGLAQLPYSPPAARTSLEQVYADFKAMQETSGQLLAWCSIIDTFVYEYGDCHPLDHWIAEMDAWLLISRNFPSPELQARVACGMFSALMYRQPYRADLREIWEPRVRAMVLHGDNSLCRVQYGSLLFLYYTHWAGDCSKGKIMLDNLSLTSEQFNLPPFVELTWYFHAGIQFFITGQIDDARQTLEKGLQVANQTGICVCDSFLCSILFYLSLLSNDIEKAKLYQEHMRLALIKTNYCDVVQYHLALCYRSIIDNELLEAREQVNQAIGAANKSGMLFFIFYSKVCSALVAIHEGKHQAALALLEEVHAGAQRNVFVSLEQASYYFEAELFFSKNEFEKCLPALREALAITHQSGLNNPLWWRDAIMSHLLSIALAYDIETDYVCSIIRQRQLTPPQDMSVPDNWPYPVKIYTLGRFSLVIEGAAVVFKGKAPKKSLELLTVLIAFGGREVSIEKITDALWPDADGDAAYQSFTMALKRLRSLLVHHEALLLSEGKLTLDPRYVWVDVWAFERDLSDLTRQEWGKALVLYKGHFLQSEPEAPWMLSLREHLLQRYLHTVEKQVAYLEQAGQYEQAIALCEQGLEFDPLTETFYQGLMRCYENCGRHGEAIKIYTQCKQALMQGLEIEPSSLTQRLYQRLQENADSQ